MIQQKGVETRPCSDMTGSGGEEEKSQVCQYGGKQGCHHKDARMVMSWFSCSEEDIALFFICTFLLTYFLILKNKRGLMKSPCCLSV
jgi:hypothetical protein